MLDKENYINFDAGFTLIELLIAISIIGILVGLSVFGLQGAREAGRDAERKGELETMRSALEVYKADCEYYPYASPPPGAQFTGTCGGVTNVYLESVPDDPLPGRDYAYVAVGCTSNPSPPPDYFCTRYRVWTSLEKAPSLPIYCPTPIPTGCGSGVACNWCVTSP